MQTFLFTDIEGSSRLWKEQPAAMSIALAQHDTVLRRAIESHQGHVFKTGGDAFFAVFPTAQQSLAAALAAQRQLAVPADSQTLQLRVRMALCSGEAEARGGDYFGTPLNLAARLIGAAHGGQILLGQSTHDALLGALPLGVELRDLGKHHLHGLTTPEQIFQIIAPDVPINFTAIRTLTPRPTNLPAQLTSFVGRDQEIAAICQRLRQRSVRLLTLTGAGGSGKTRMALQVAASLLDEFTDGVFFTTLEPLTQPPQVIEAIAHVFELRERVGESLLDALQEHLHDQHLLLVLDNFEQVLDAAPLVNQLLKAAPNLKVLTTSREALSVYGEQLYAVQPLPLPDLQRLPTVESMRRLAAVALFVERVQAAQPDFALTEANAASAARICVALEGLPLAIELAAARTAHLTLEDISTQLSNQLELLQSRFRDLPARQRTMRGAIDWSYDLLLPEEQHQFAWLAVFAGAFSAQSAQAVVGSADLTGLVDKSLLQQTKTDGGVYFTMLGVIRAYALDKLTASGDIEATQRRHADTYLALTESAEPHLTSPDSEIWFSRLLAEHDNLRAALTWALAQNEIETAARIVSVLWRLWNVHSYLSEGQRWMSAVLDQGEGLPDALRAKVLQGAGQLVFFLRDYARAESLLAASVELYGTLDDKSGLAYTLLKLGESKLRQADFAHAEAFLTRSLVMFQELDDKSGIARVLNNLGNTAQDLENYAQAAAFLRESVALQRDQGESEGLALALNNLAEVLRAQGNFQEAAAFYRESLALFRRLGIPANVVILLLNLGTTMRDLGHYRQSADFLLQALEMLRGLEENELIAECVAALAGTALHLGESFIAVKLFGATAALFTSLGIELELLDQSAYERAMKESHTHLSDGDWQKAWDEGQTMAAREVLEFALGAVSHEGVDAAKDLPSA